MNTKTDYSDLERKVEQLRQKRLRSPHGPSQVPYRAKVKRMAHKSFQRQDELELSRHPSGLNMYTAKETGARLATASEELRIKNSSTNCNTTTFVAGR